MLYADVILPLPVEGCFTYSIPAALQGKALCRCRVLVPFGRKTYTALVARCHDEQPPFAVKNIYAVLDETPILLPTQYKLWEWMADYYLAPLGDVYNAALPAGLKAQEGYKPRTETYVRLAEAFRAPEAIALAQTLLRRAPQQLAAFNAFLSLSVGEAQSITAVAPRAVTREELLNSAPTTLPILRALCQRGVLTTYTRPVARLAIDARQHIEPMKPLSAPQQEAYDAIVAQFATRATVLLHGVTSSGKTEIYIHLIQQTIARGEQALYLLPEIALTVQIMQRLRAVFGSALGIYHSRYSDAERVEIWRKQLSPEPYKVILGARSAVFLPFQKLGMVIIDEEHESSFKQQEPAPRYHARSAALMLAQMCHAKTILGTATPSMESYYNAQRGKYGLVTLTSRYEGIALPAIEVVDVGEMRRRKLMRGSCAPPLTSAIRQALDDGKQVILFHNRRGYARQVECAACGWVPRCTNCDVPLTLHRTSNLLTCHYCGYTSPVPARCPACDGTDLWRRGMGTEKVEDELRRHIPQARVARMDLDSTRTHNAYDRLLGDFAAGTTNVLVGTQMVTKGLDFDNVAVVGILDADTLLNKPDFRAYEQAFQMMAQVSGRAGRKGQQGRVFLQTRMPTLAVIQHIVNNDFAAFYAATARERRTYNYPPYTHLIAIELHHRHDSTVETAAQHLAALLRQTFAHRVLGPERPLVARVKQQYIRKIHLKIENNVSLSLVRPHLRQARAALMQDKSLAAVTVFFDVDPL